MSSRTVREIIRGAQAPTWTTTTTTTVPLDDDVVEEVRKRRFRKAMALATDIGLTDDERYELAQMLSDVDKDDGGSWKVLNPKQLHDLICYMEGFVYITHLLSERQ